MRRFQGKRHIRPLIASVLFLPLAMGCATKEMSVNTEEATAPVEEKAASADKEVLYPEAPASAPVQERQRVVEAEVAAPMKSNMRRSGAPTTTGRAGQGSTGKPSYEGFGEVYDEVWVIQKPDVVMAPSTADKPLPGSGELRVKLPGKKELVPLPLQHTGVNGAVDGYVASVKVSQRYANPYDTKIEVVYAFPLPQNAAVSNFVMVIGERKIRGIIREKEEAERIYKSARSQGYTAALLQQERPNIFTQKIANIEPGREITVDVHYFNTLHYRDGEYRFVFPMVVGSRYNPPGYSDGIGSVARGAQGTSGQSTEISCLAPDERSGHDISLTVAIDAGVEIEALRSETHAIEVKREGASRATVSIRPADTLPNKDFVLNYKVAGDKVKTTLIVEPGKTPEQPGYFSLILQPPAKKSDLARAAKEMVFVIDTSGSMNDWPIQKAQQAAIRALKNLQADDTLQVIRFAGSASQLSPKPLPATPENIRRAVDYVETLRGGGGTEMLTGIKAALDFPQDPKRFRVVSFMTDGFIGNEDQIIRAIHERRGEARLFSFGVGSSVNRYLMESMAKAGHGAVAYMTTHESPVGPVDEFYEIIGHPALTNVDVQWGTLEVDAVYPARIPDLFVGRPVIITGRYTGELPETVTVRGIVAGEYRTFVVETKQSGERQGDKGISNIWARAKIADLMNEMVTEGHTLAREDELRETALAHNLVSHYTSFVASDSTRRTRGDHGVTVNQPVPVPEGVLYETMVQE